MDGFYYLTIKVKKSLSVNKSDDGDIGFISWSRIIEDDLFIENYKALVKSKNVQIKMYKLI